MSIVPSSKRSDSERERFLGFRHSLERFDQLPSLVESAKLAMGLEPDGGGFSADIVPIEISGPTRPHLTVVDLPGLIHSKNDDRDDKDIEDVVSQLVDSYMQRTRTIILAVVSAQNDRALQAILKRAKAVDPEGNRTMGLITKPDTLPPGSDSEKEFVKLARNGITKFRLGWHVLMNRDYDMRNSSDAERDAREVEFFSRGVWVDLPHGLLGISALRERISKVLLDHIKSELPALIEEIQQSLEGCSGVLTKLGDPLQVYGSLSTRRRSIPKVPNIKRSSSKRRGHRDVGHHPIPINRCMGESLHRLGNKISHGRIEH